jgi:hypothetical protein
MLASAMSSASSWERTLEKSRASRKLCFTLGAVGFGSGPFEEDAKTRAALVLCRLLLALLPEGEDGDEAAEELGLEQSLQAGRAAAAAAVAAAAAAAAAIAHQALLLDPVKSFANPRCCFCICPLWAHCGIWPWILHVAERLSDSVAPPLPALLHLSFLFFFGLSSSVFFFFFFLLLLLFLLHLLSSSSSISSSSSSSSSSSFVFFFFFFFFFVFFFFFFSFCYIFAK